MQYHRSRPAVVLLILALIPFGVLAADDGSGGAGLLSADSPAGYGHVFPAPDPSEVVDVPPPFPASPASGTRTRQFPAAAEPQPTFAPDNNITVYVAARDSTITPENATVYRCDGAGDEVEINSAIAAAQGGVVELLDGAFRCSGRITLRANTTLAGQGSSNTTIEIVAKPGSTGYLPVAIGAEYVNVGGFSIRGNAFVMVTRSHVRVRDVLATSIDLDGVWRPASGNGMFFVWAAPPVTVIDDVEFYECHAVDCHTHGFNMNQDYSDRVCRATTNIRFLNCRAVRCGFGRVGDPGVTDATNQSRSEWITGFDFHEWQDLVNCEVVNCVAEDNWESGFHLEPGARYGSNGESIGPRTISKNIVFRNCVSSNNGQRNTYANHFFMSGYYLSRDTHLENCVSFNNRNCGYYVHGGAYSSFDGCTDVGSTYGWKVCKASSDITLTDCTSRNNRRWALWLAFSRRVSVAGFRHSGVVSDRGYQSILGWYKDEAAYQQPVTDSSFEITSTGNGMPILNQAGSGNTYSLRWEGSGAADPVCSDFSAAPILGDAPLRVQFTDRSVNETVRCWDFGDGEISPEENPLHVYGIPGNYTVTLISANDFLYDTETKTGHISVMGPVTASFGATPTLVPVGGSVRFTDTSTGNPYSRAWDFGDGGRSSERNPVHVYTAPGTYTVSLTAGNTHFSDTRAVSNLVTVCEPVNASFSANRTAGPAPLVVRFTDISTGSPTAWMWNFGDGATSKERDPVHTYAAPGTYDVSLTVANAVGSDCEAKVGIIAATLPPPAVVALLGMAAPPTDTDGDGLYEDLNGNGRKDFADVVLYFNQMTWIAANEPIAAVDFNGNGRVDFADVVWLFNRL